ncbi:hypothetical protein [Nocardioides mesophilus]|uniref:HTH cro/C1-type domain-containing protein n=1 Tax=Nocardioides mesophilus TaxID=433659 RepID=A0A7G9REI8_9ACTN|nr:hypothetical protein [Nocardioides mesophilus]QNN54013.1 hypothetical protein H9L09_06435 [Nocardioides mesophilus]
MKLAEPSWLLRATRVNATDSRWRTASVFAQGTDDVPAVNRSQVTRWERGEIAPTYAVVRRYEIICGLPEGHLATAFDLVHRHAHPVAAAPALRRPMPQDPGAVADHLVGRALDGGPVTGLEWDQLSAMLGETPMAFMLGRDWQQLVRRGLREMDVSVRLGYCQRSEAMSRIAGHPRASGHVVDLTRAILNDPDAQVYSEAASLLRYVDHPDAHRLLYDVIADPVGPHALRAALYAAATMVRDRRTPHPVAVDLVRQALDIARDVEHPYRVRRSAADVLLALRPATRTSIAEEFRRRPEDLALASIISGDGPRPRSQGRALRGRIVEQVQDQVDGSLHDQPQLLRLLTYITVESNDELRSFALNLLMLLPFGPAVGHAYLTELRSCVEHGDMFGIHEALGVLIALAPGEDLSLVTDLAVRAVPVPADVDQVAVEACWALGNAPVVTLSADPDDRIAEAVRQSWQQKTAICPDLVGAWAYVLGMRGRRDLLESLVPPAGVATGAVWDNARRWWLDAPAHALGSRSC